MEERKELVYPPLPPFLKKNKSEESPSFKLRKDKHVLQLLPIFLCSRKYFHIVTSLLRKINIF